MSATEGRHNDIVAMPERPAHESLSDREYRVMWMMANGRPINEIAKEMALSPSTISTYRLRVLRKLKLNSNADIVKYAMRNRLVE